jgi:nucleoside-diphosphate-sugar epimerase
MRHLRIAILGATSQIGKDLVVSFSTQSKHELVLYSRRPGIVSQWLVSVGLASRYVVADFAAFSADEHFDAILNFVGVGNPAQAAVMGASIFEVTLKYDEMALDYVRQQPACRYIFLSSGAAYGSSFDKPVDENTMAVIAINDLKPQDWYAVAKLHAECRHRALAPLPIVDIRIFNYFSNTQDLDGRFLISDIVRSIKDKTVFKTTSDYIVRDFIHPTDFYSLVNSILSAPTTNVVIDAYSKAPIDKLTLLNAMQERFGLQFEIVQESASVNATGSKPHYYTLNKRAMDYGYEPQNTSIDGLILECDKILKIM